MTKLERARATVRCNGKFHADCELTMWGPVMEALDIMDFGKSVEERHEIVASLILDGEPS